ncbi:MAG: DUF3048 domain-containing protein [Firmicutes bacterium]|nr:DUF3048 domain-containing protein [Bacillota bacterium]
MKHKAFLGFIPFLALALIMLSSLLFLSGCLDSDKEEDIMLTDTAEASSGTDSEDTAEGSDSETYLTEADTTESAVPVAESMPETETETETEEDTTAEEEEDVIPTYFNPLTGLGTDTDLSSARPVAIMINNIKKANPSYGLSDADVIYECLAEGGITRLLMISLDYSNLGVVGSIRSSRPYYITFAFDYGAIYIHAGGSDDAYAMLKSSGIAYLDGVNMYLPDMFYRDSTRWSTMGYEHSLMTTGSRIVSGIAYKGYRTTKSSSVNYPLSFVEYGESANLSGMSGSQNAAGVTLKYSSSQTVDFKYNEATGEYLRYQFGGSKHIDGATGEQLSFKNVIIILTDISEIEGDDAGRLSVVTTGSGNGYYISEGVAVPIKWSRKSDTSGITYTNSDGGSLTFNRGTTFVCVFDKDSYYKIEG